VFILRGELSGCFGGGFDGFEQVGITAAAAEIAVERRDDLLTRWILFFAEERDGGHDHAGDAIAALHALVLDEGFLDRVKLGVGLIVGAEAFNGLDFFTRRGGDRSKATLDWPAIDQDGAGAAGTFAATVFGAGESQVLAKHIEQRPVRLGRNLAGLAIEGELNLGAHTQECLESFTPGEVTM
jgi:hypothetical protein